MSCTHREYHNALITGKTGRPVKFYNNNNNIILHAAGIAV